MDYNHLYQILLKTEEVTSKIEKHESPLSNFQLFKFY